jgi:hypothetical protein
MGYSGPNGVRIDINQVDLCNAVAQRRKIQVITIPRAQYAQASAHRIRGRQQQRRNPLSMCLTAPPCVAGLPVAQNLPLCERVSCQVTQRVSDLT